MSNVMRLESMYARNAHPQNVPGDFYVEDQCCMLCAIPHSEAPNLFGTTEDESHCFVKKQPATEDEMAQMVSAIECAELKCIRYKGTQRSIQIRLVEINEGSVCDALPADLKEISDRLERQALDRWKKKAREERSEGAWWRRLWRLIRPNA